MLGRMARSPDPEALPDFAAYVAERRAALVRTATAVGHDPDRAEDLVHTALLHVLPHWSGLSTRAAADAYVRRALVNQQISWTRRAAVRREWATADVPEPRLPLDDVPDGTAYDEVPRVRALLALLPPRQREAVVLRVLEGLTVEETARVLGVAPGTVKSNTSRGLAALRAHLEPTSMGLAG